MATSTGNVILCCCALLCLYALSVVYARSKRAGQVEHMDCQVSTEALDRCQSSIKAYTDAIAAAQAEARANQEAITKRNAEIVAWQSEYDRQFELRKEGREANSKQVWYQNKLYNCDNLPVGS